MATAAAPYTRTEELAHSLTAGLGILACAFAIPALVWVSFGDPWRMVAGIVFGISALAMFVTSVVYHWASDPERKLLLRKLDHSAIYLLIAGTYTPVTLIALDGAWGWAMFGIVWTLAVLGIIAKTTVGFRFPKLSVALYVGMGWLAMVAIEPMYHRMTGAQLSWLLAGGLLYTGGVPFYVWKSRKFTHAVWHLFILGGVACHFVMVMSIVNARS